MGIDGDKVANPRTRSAAPSVAVEHTLGQSATNRGQWRRASLFAAADVGCFAVAIAASGIRYLRTPTSKADLLLQIVAVFGWLATFAAFGLYRSDLLSAPEELRRIIGATSVGTVLVIAEGALLDRYQASMPILTLWMVATVSELGTRRVWRWHLARMKQVGSIALRALVVGTDASAAKAAESLRRPGSGFHPVAFVATASSISYPGQWPTIPSPVAGAVDQLEDLIEQSAAERVFVVSGCVSPEEMLQMSRICRRTGVEVRVSANLPETLTSRVTLQDVNGTMALCLRPVRLGGANAALKRAFDLSVAAVGLAVLLLPSIAVGSAIRLTSPGPVLFRQERVTKGGRRFTIYKFRTMRCEDDVALETSVPFFKLEHDPRTTAVGSFLRRFSVDEWPQLWNVVKGDMSLVGPRPLAAEQVENITQHEALYERQEVRAGITGWWQINGRSDVAIEEALRLDAFYVENWSLTLDLYVLLKTAGAVLARKGAY